jgi:4-hydroxybenzoate polyprenyltransferase
LIEAALRARKATLARGASLAEVAGAGLRVRQWTKNLLLFAGLLFAAKLGDIHRWGEAVLAFTVYCAASSAAYLLNDVRDAARDRLHPTKRRRPVASGLLALRTALAMSAGLACAALAGALLLGPVSVLLVVGFAALQLAYSYGLKLVVGLDVLAIATLFTLRGAAGAEAVRVRVSPWLLVCTGLLALFLALAKRRGELAAGNGEARSVLVHYSLTVVDRLLVAVALTIVVVYTAYALTARDSMEMAVTIPLVLAAVGRYLVLIHRHGLGEQPEEILLSDLPILLTVGTWVLAAALVLTLT